MARTCATMGASEQVPRKLVSLTQRAFSFAQKTAYLFGARCAVHRSCYAGTPVLAHGFLGHDERRTLRVQQQEAV